MSPQNKAFIGAVNFWRSQFIELLVRAKVHDIVYPSMHFCERVVERNLDKVDVLYLIVPIIKEFRQSTFNERTFIVQWRNIGVACCITTGKHSERRHIVIKTIYDKFDPAEFDVVIKL